MRRPGILLLLLIVMGSMVLTGCGEKGDDKNVASLNGTTDGDDGDEASETSMEDQALAFSKCMRENGVPDFPDPEVNGDGGMMMARPEGAGELDEDASRKAMEACQDKMPRGGGDFSEADRSKMQDALLEYAACMRKNGVDMPDPDFSDGGGAFRMGGPDAAEDPKFEEAHAACEDKLGAGEPPR